MTELMANAPRLGPDAFEDLAGRHFGLSGTLVPLYSERDQNMLLRAADGRGWVLKIANAAEEPALVAAQIAALRHIARADPDLPVPESLVHMLYDAVARVQAMHEGKRRARSAKH